MSTVYVRDVRPQVVDVLKARAAVAGTSLSAYIAAELDRVAARPSNAEIAARLAALDRSEGPTRDDILAELERGRR